MANDKNFKVKNALEIGKSLKTSLGTVTSSNIDLSTGNYFKDTTNTTTYTISNPSPAQSFQLELTGGNADVVSNFKNLSYTGTGSAQTLTTGFDLATDGGMIWTKWRNATLGSANHNLVDTVRGANKSVATNDNGAQSTASSISGFTSTGYTLAAANGPGGATNYNNAQYVSWTWKRATKFFDVVTYTGDGNAGKTVNHNLGSVPGMILFKRTDDAANWATYHNSLNGGTNPHEYLIKINQTGYEADNATFLNDTAPTSTQFTLGTTSLVNANGGSYVAYLFGHETGSDSMIKCGYFLNNQASQDVEVNIGFKPQWLLLKGASAGSGLGNWHIYDNLDVRAGKQLEPNSSDGDANGFITFTTNGFTPSTYYGGNLIYVAIREAGDPAITWPGTVKWPGGITPTAPGIGETDLYTFTTDDSGSSYYGYLSGDNLS